MASVMECAVVRARACGRECVCVAVTMCMVCGRECVRSCASVLGCASARMCV